MRLASFALRKMTWHALGLFCTAPGLHDMYDTCTNTYKHTHIGTLHPHTKDGQRRARASKLNARAHAPRHADGTALCATQAILAVIMR